jgi:hypothetical protein
MMFGSIRGLDNFVSDDGFSRALPILECYMIYSQDDVSLERPLWITSKFARLREGTVTVDSLKYELDKK